MTAQSINLSLVAGTSRYLNVSGEFIHADTAADPIGVSVNGTGNSVTLEQSRQLRTPFNQVEIYSDTTQTVRLVYGFGEYVDDRQTTTVSVTANVTPGDTLATAGPLTVLAGATSLLLPADADRQEAYISVDVAEPNAVHVGDAGAGALAPGFQLDPGGRMVIPTQAAIYIYNPGAASVAVNATANRRP